MSRAIIEGLFGIHPDALSGTLTVAPGFPQEWTHARLAHPDISLTFKRDGRIETWDLAQSGQLFQRLKLRIPAAFTGVSSIDVNGRPARWHADQDAVGRPMLEVEADFTSSASIHISWSGDRVPPAQTVSSSRSGGASGFKKESAGAFSWWASTSTPIKIEPAPGAPTNWLVVRPGARFEPVDLTSFFNDQVTKIFSPGKYLSPRSNGVSLSLPSQGAGAWAGHVGLLPVIDDSGLRSVVAEHGDRLEMPNGVTFRTPSSKDSTNILFTSQWSNYPQEATIPLKGHARHAYLLMAGSTNFMQSHMDNGEVLITYTDGTSARLALRNPETWWPIEQDYFIDDYQFPLVAPLPPRVDLKTGTIRVLQNATFRGKGREVAGGAATVLDLALDPNKQLRNIVVRALTNDSIIGLMSLTLELP